MKNTNYLSDYINVVNEYRSIMERIENDTTETLRMLLSENDNEIELDKDITIDITNSFTDEYESVEVSNVRLDENNRIIITINGYELSNDVNFETYIVNLDDKIAITMMAIKSVGLN